MQGLRRAAERALPNVAKASLRVHKTSFNGYYRIMQQQTLCQALLSATRAAVSTRALRNGLQALGSSVLLSTENISICTPARKRQFVPDLINSGAFETHCTIPCCPLDNPIYQYREA